MITAYVIFENDTGKIVQFGRQDDALLGFLESEGKTVLPVHMDHPVLGHGFPPPFKVVDGVVVAIEVEADTN